MRLNQDFDKWCTLSKYIKELINKKQYNVALRNACNNEMGYEIVELLLNNKEKLNINIDEPGATSLKTAVDYARINKDKRILALLEAHKATLKNDLPKMGS